jgi:GntR family transcriptional regulator/MocR family aminotransferase
MLTYDLNDKKTPKYLQLYDAIKSDIAAGVISSDTKLPSRRSFAANLGVSTVTVDNAYDQLLEEGYIYSLPKKGYFVAPISMLPSKVQPPSKSRAFTLVRDSSDSKTTAGAVTDVFNFSKNSPDPGNFPFSVWAKLSRSIISEKSHELLKVSPSRGVSFLREQIAAHLSSYRGMNVYPDQIVIGAGTEYLYRLIIKLLGNNRKYCLENPCYKKITQVYKLEGITPYFANLDSDGIIISDFEKEKADIVHISPNHHFPTGITTPIKRRHELLSWAYAKNGR